MAASRPIVMPKLGLTMTEGMLAEWRVAAGDRVAPGDILFVVETDKIANEIEASHAGVVQTLLTEPGATVPVGAVVGTLAVDGDDAPPGDMAATETAPPSPAPTPAAPAPVAEPRRIVATPLARRRAAAAGLDIATITGSGPRGRIMAGDLPEPGALPPPSASPVPQPAPIADRMIEPDAWRKVTARRLTEAKREIPHFYVFARADVTALLALREQLNTHGDGPKLTVSHFLLAAVARALAAVPEMNRVWAGEAIREFGTIAIGLAVEGAKGLVAPVLHGPGGVGLGGLGLDEIATSATALITRAREGRLAQADLSGGAISISNVGMFGVSALVPIINPGQSSILGVGASQPLFLPDAQGQPVLRQVLELALACDHRVIDGALAARFLQAVCRHLECAAALLRRPSGS